MKVLLTQRNDVELYPPVLHQAEILRRQHDVRILDLESSDASGKLLTDATVVRQRVRLGPAKGRLGNALERLRRSRSYRSQLHSLVDSDPQVVIAFEPRAINLVLSRAVGPATRRIAHLHELPGADASANLAERCAVDAMWRRLRSADLVVVPDLHRGRYVRAAARLRATPMVVMNCPMLLPHLPASRLLPYLAARGAPMGKIVHYQGAIGPMKSLEAIVASMPDWPGDSVFVLVGRIHQPYVDQLLRLAAQHGVRERLIFVGAVPYDQVFSFAVGAAVGMTMLEPVMPNWKFSAGASNKRFEYIALGIPQVTVDTPGVEELFCRPGVARLAATIDPGSIASAVNFYLSSEERRAEIASRARKLHVESYNYERQFGPLEQWIANGSAARRHG